LEIYISCGYLRTGERDDGEETKAEPTSKEVPKMLSLTKDMVQRRGNRGWQPQLDRALYCPLHPAEGKNTLWDVIEMR
jgi:hypothetical protein